MDHASPLRIAVAVLAISIIAVVFGLPLPTATAAELYALPLLNTDDGALVALGPSEGGAVYYLAKGKRYVFPNERTYRSWYHDFFGVRYLRPIDRTAFAAIPTGGLVTYRPGVRMVKFVSSPIVYAVARGGVLRPIASEAVARQLYGEHWNTLIDDLSETFFTAYRIGDPITAVSQFNPRNERHATTSIFTNLGLATVPYVAANALAEKLCGGVSQCTASSDLKSQFHCDSISGVFDFQPKVPMASCNIMSNRMNPVPAVFQYGGLVSSATNILIERNGQLQLIDTMSAFQATFTPIIDLHDAVNFVIAVTRGKVAFLPEEVLPEGPTMRSARWLVARELVLRESAPSQIGDAWWVTMFHRTNFPCPIVMATRTRYLVHRGGALDGDAGKDVASYDGGFCAD